jgi:geranylgeranylglycerol-phosphate geranylgeranyltransferase
MIGIAVIVGSALASPIFLNQLWLNLIYGFITGFALTGASMTINDIYDKEIDIINEPKRPIPSGLIKSKEALIFAIFITIIGFLAAIMNSQLTNLGCLTIAIIAWIVFVVYTTIGKRSGLPGNLLVSICVAIPFIYGSYVATGTINLNVMIFAFIAFLSNTGREITKGIADIKGDKIKKINTLAVIYGGKNAAKIGILFYLSAVLLSPLPWFLNLVSIWFIPLVAVTDFGLILSSLNILKDQKRENAKKVKNQVLYWSILGLLAFIIGTIK